MFKSKILLAVMLSITFSSSAMAHHHSMLSASGTIGNLLSVFMHYKNVAVLIDQGTSRIDSTNPNVVALNAAIVVAQLINPTARRHLAIAATLVAAEIFVDAYTGVTYWNENSSWKSYAIPLAALLGGGLNYGELVEHIHQ